MVGPSGKTILVIEDDAALRELHRQALISVGYRVRAVEDGLDALRDIDAGLTPDAVVLDLGLLRVDGRDVQKELRAHPQTSTVPVIVATGQDPGDLLLGAFDCVMRKPFTEDTLIAAVANCISRHSLVAPPGRLTTS